jgi:hypothetical protein
MTLLLALALLFRRGLSSFLRLRVKEVQEQEVRLALALRFVEPPSKVKVMAEELMKIFGTKSPVDFINSEKPKLERLKPGRLKALAKRLGPLLDAKSLLDKVYSNGYFENHYPDADVLLKNKLHERAMQAWAHAESMGDDDDIEPKANGSERKISLTINVGTQS